MPLNIPTSTRAMAPPPPRGSGRWARVRRRRTGENALPQVQRYQQVIGNDALETHIQNTTSPFPPTYVDHVSQRRVASRDASLARACIRVAADHFSTHVLPTPEEFERAGAARRTRKRVDKDEYIPDEPVDAEDIPAPRVRPLTLAELYATSVRNKEVLRMLPPQLSDKLFRQVCLASPRALTKEVLATYFLPYVGTNSVRVRPCIFLPASLPLFSNDYKAASLLLATLAGQLSLSKSASVVTRAIRALDLHGHTRMQSGALTRLLQAPNPKSRPDAPAAPPRTIPQKRPAVAVPVSVSLPNWSLERVTLCGCLAIGDDAIHALVRASGHSLLEIDLSTTSVTPAVIGIIGAHAPKLQRLSVGACEGFTNELLLKAVGDAVSHAAAASWIPFQHLVDLDVSRTTVGDVGVGGILRLCGSHLRALDVGYTRVGEHGSLDMLRMGLGRSSLERVGLSGLVLHATALVSFVREQRNVRWLALDDMVEYARRQGSSLSGHVGLTGMALYAIAHAVGPSLEHISIRGDKRQCATGKWMLPADWLPPLYGLGEALSTLFCSVAHIDLAGLEIRARDLVGSPPPPASRVTHLTLASTNISDEGLLHLVPWTGRLEALYLDDTPVTCEALDALVAANPALSLLSLSHCRGIPVRERRRFFDAYTARKQ